MRYRTEGERNACVWIKPHGRPGIVNATAATPSTSRKREERSKYDRGEYELKGVPGTWRLFKLTREDAVVTR